MKFTFDVKEGFSASHDLLTGWDYTRVVVQEDIDDEGTAFSSTDDLINWAEGLLIAHADPSVGSISGFVGDRGSSYQMGDDGPIVYLKAFVPEVLSPTAIKWMIVYRGFPLLAYEGDGALGSFESNLDNRANSSTGSLGNTITVSYTYPANYGQDDNGGDTSKAGKRYIQSVFLQRDSFEPVFSVRFLIVRGDLVTRIRGVDNPPLVDRPATELMTAIVMYTGTCNDDDWTIGVLTGSPHQWKIIRVAASSRDQGLTYDATMSFQYRERGWDKTATFINPDTGLPPPDLKRSTVIDVSDPRFPEYAGIPPATTPDIGQTIAATADESTFPKFGTFANGGAGPLFPDVVN